MFKKPVTETRRDEQEEEEEKRVEINHSTIDKTHTYTQEFNVDIPQSRVDGRDWESIQKVEIGHVDTARDMPSRLIHQSRATTWRFFFLLPFFFSYRKMKSREKKEKQQKQLDNSITKAGLGDKGDIARNVWFTQTKSGNYQTRL